jgi:methylthioribulose-1-phosphate dehydratase
MTRPTTVEPEETGRAARELAELARWAHASGLVPATSGNFSLRVADDPFRLAVTASGRDKGALTEADVVVVDETGKPVDSDGRPSAESPGSAARASSLTSTRSGVRCSRRRDRPVPRS